MSFVTYGLLEVISEYFHLLWIFHCYLISNLMLLIRGHCRISVFWNFLDCFIKQHLYCILVNIHVHLQKKSMLQSLDIMFNKCQWALFRSVFLQIFFCLVILSTEIRILKSLDLCIFPFRSSVLFHVFWSFAIKNFYSSFFLLWCY